MAGSVTVGAASGASTTAVAVSASDSGAAATFFLAVRFRGVFWILEASMCSVVSTAVLISLEANHSSMVAARPALTGAMCVQGFLGSGEGMPSASHFRMMSLLSMPSFLAIWKTLRIK